MSCVWLSPSTAPPRLLTLLVPSTEMRFVRVEPTAHAHSNTTTLSIHTHTHTHTHTRNRARRNSTPPARPRA
ncbi:hypothetical protein LZ31DRAFT_222538 [Colletotrichum somersetense]|nr:hypothetical protein LZ31DRAFT_222538 [Colletotrichum somersetense]